MKKLLVMVFVFLLFAPAAFSNGRLKVLTPGNDYKVFIDDDNLEVSNKMVFVSLSARDHKLNVEDNYGEIIYSKTITIVDNKITVVDIATEIQNLKPTKKKSELRDSPFEAKEKNEKDIANIYYFDIENYNHLYKEPAFMQEYGSMLGFMYTSINRYYKNKYSIKLQLRYASGGVNYESASGKFQGISDNVFESRLLYGFDRYLATDSLITLYCGLGWRTLTDNLQDAGAGGYRRVSSYTYLPIEIEYGLKMAESASFGFVIGYDYLLSGMQTSYWDDIDPRFDPIVNTQRSGSGYRWDIKYSKESGKYDIGVKIFSRYWNINKSEKSDIVFSGVVVGEGWEPTNLTIEQGVSIYIKY